MKQYSLFFILLFSLCLCGFSQSLTREEALQTVNELFKESDEAPGFHSLDLFSKRKLADRDKSYADESAIHFQEKVGEESKAQFYEYADLKKIVVLNGKKAKYGPSFFGDHQMLIHYKQTGRLIIIGISAENVKSFEGAIRLLAPSIKKVNYVN